MSGKKRDLRKGRNLFCTEGWLESWTSLQQRTVLGEDDNYGDDDGDDDDDDSGDDDDNDDVDNHEDHDADYHACQRWPLLHCGNW